MFNNLLINGDREKSKNSIIVILAELRYSELNTTSLRQSVERMLMFFVSERTYHSISQMCTVTEEHHQKML